jgi:uncharacterized caspase-like protein
MNKALCIGIADYSYISSLKNPINDATDIADQLSNLNYQITLVRNPNRINLLRELKKFQLNKVEVEASVIFYAGHGVQSGGQNYLIPTDANPQSEDELDIYCVDLDYFVFQDSNNLNGVNILILDACRNDPFSRAWSRSPSQIGFAPVLAPSGTLISFSTSPGKISSDGPGRNGLFTAALLTEISKPDVSVIQVFQNVR